MSLSHGQIKDVLKEWKWEYQPIDQAGVCFGLAIMGLIAIHTNDVNYFDFRNIFLANILQKLTPAQLVKSMREVEEKRVTIITAYKKELLIALNQDLQLSDKEFYRIINGKEFQHNPFVIQYHKQYDNIDSVLTYEDQLLSIVSAYLQCIYTAFFSPVLLPFLYKKRDMANYQNAEKILLRVLPHALIKKVYYKKKGITSRIFSKEKPLIKKATNVCGIYTKEEMYIYLKELCLLSRKFSYQPLGLFLHNTNHAICITYNIEHECWYLIDINKLPTQKIDTHKQMADALFTSFASKNRVAMTTEIFCHETILEPLQKVLIRRRKTKAWKKIHAAEGKQVLVDDQTNVLAMEAIRNHDYATFKELMECKNPSIDLNYSVKGATLFNNAIYYGNNEIIDLIFADKSHPIDPNILYLNRFSALYVAVQNSQIRTIKLLLTISDPLIDIDLAGSGESTALEYAIKCNEIEICKILLDAGANINLARHSGYTPNHYAIACKNLILVQELLKRKANLELITHQGDTPLLVAIKMKDLAIVKAILDNDYHPIDPAAAVNNSVSPIEKAKEIGDEEIIKLLLDPKYSKKAFEVKPAVLSVSSEIGTKSLSKKRLYVSSMVPLPKKASSALRVNTLFAAAANAETIVETKITPTNKQNSTDTKQIQPLKKHCHA